MTTMETTAPGTCGEHGDRPAVGTCGRCGRPLCVECAVPFRGSVRCQACAALELGDPAPSVKPRRTRLGLEPLALVLLVVGVAATVPPWHRSGTLTSVLSVWRPTPDTWSFVAAVCITLAGVICAISLRRRRRAAGWPVAWATAAWLGSAAALISLIRVPDFFTVTAAPMAVMLAAAAAGVLGLVRTRRLRP